MVLLKSNCLKLTLLQTDKRIIKIAIKNEIKETFEKIINAQIIEKTEPIQE
jgi:hypothetical protein